MRKLILASDSPRRKELLSQAGYEFQVEPSFFEEKIDEFTGTPLQLVESFAREKARYVALRYRRENVIVLGADTVVVVDEEVLGKPLTKNKAYDMLRRLSGRGHEVISGYALIDCSSGEETVGHDITRVFFHDLTEQQINNYSGTKESQQRAGGYSAHESARPFLQSREGSYSNAMGLPMEKVKPVLDQLLRR